MTFMRKLAAVLTSIWAISAVASLVGVVVPSLAIFNESDQMLFISLVMVCMLVLSFYRPQAAAVLAKIDKFSSRNIVG